MTNVTDLFHDVSCERNSLRELILDGDDSTKTKGSKFNLLVKNILELINFIGELTIFQTKCTEFVGKYTTNGLNFLHLISEHRRILQMFIATTNNNNNNYNIDYDNVGDAEHQVEADNNQNNRRGKYNKIATNPSHSLFP